MEKKTKIMLVVGLAVGVYLLYQKQASASPFTWLPIMKQTPTGPLAQGTAPAAAVGIAAGLSLLPKAFQLMGGIFNSTANAVVDAGTNVSAGAIPSIPGTGVLLDSPSYLLNDPLQYQLPAGGGVLLPDPNGSSGFLDYGQADAFI